jgi:hypothetical protein
LTGQEFPYESPVKFSDSESEDGAAHFRDSGELDLAVAYVLGEATEEERFGFETALAKGDENANYSYTNATKSISKLTGILSPEAPPPFAKERVMARVREDSVMCFMPPPEQ